jgi:hypothetical protein
LLRLLSWFLVAWLVGRSVGWLVICSSNMYIYRIMRTYPWTC